MVRGSSKLAPWCGAVGRQCGKVRGSVIITRKEPGNQRLTFASNAANPVVVDGQAYRCFSSSPGSSAGLLRRGGGGGEGYGIRNSGHFSTVAHVTDVGSKSSDNEVSFGASPLRDETLAGEKGISFRASQFPGAPDFKVEDEGFFRVEPTHVDSKSSSASVSSPSAQGTQASGKGPYFAASQFPESPQPRLRNDRYFRSRNNSSVANMLKLLEAASSQEEVEKILEDEISDSTVSSRWPWLPLLDALQRGPKPYLALEVFHWKKDKFDGGDPREYAKMISTAGKLNQLELATTLFKEMEEKGVKRSPITCNALMSAYSKNDQADGALAIFREMQEGDDCKPTLVTYNTVISMYSKLSVPEMEKYFDLCKSSGFYPDRVTFNSMIWGYMRGKEFDKMEEMYEQLKSSGCRPDPITFSALIIGFSKANQMEKMELSFSHMQEEGFPISTMIAEILTEFYSLDKKFEKMERIMKIVTNTPGTSCSSRIYGFAIQSYAESGRIGDMEETMDKMFTSKRLFTAAKTLESVITAYGSRSNFEGLDPVLQRIKSMGWSYQHSTYHTLLYEYGKGREFGKMEEIFKEMESAVDVEPTDETYKIIADSYRGAGDEEGLKWTVDRMSAAGFKTKEVGDTEVDRIWTDDEIFGGRPR